MAGNFKDGCFLAQYSLFEIQVKWVVDCGVVPELFVYLSKPLHNHHIKKTKKTFVLLNIILNIAPLKIEQMTNFFAYAYFFYFYFTGKRGA